MKTKKLLQFGITIIFSVITIIFIEKFGLLASFGGYLLFFGAIFIYKLWAARELFITNLKIAEVRIFGRSLDRDQWQKDELKNLKIKVGWGKQKTKPFIKPRTDLDEELKIRSGYYDK